MSNKLVNSFDELGRDFTRGVSMPEFSKQCALIAEQFAIGFAEWLSMFTQEFEDGDLRHWNKDKWERKSIKELLEIYKKEKQNESNFSR
jgi:hypothetical protein